MFDTDDTIVGIASAAGGSIRGVVRLSGPGLVNLLQRCFETSPHRRIADLKRASLAEAKLDLGYPLGSIPGDLYVWPTKRSYTRQPSAEFHTIGSPPLLDAVVRTVCAAGARLAEPGEFTMRAFLAGRLDLTQAEAVLGVIDARNDSDLETALAQLAGGLSVPLNECRNQLLDLLAHLEAGLDFVEEDIEFISDAELLKQIEAVSAIIEQTLDRISSRGQCEPEYRVAFVGCPNVGKSSLFNAIVGDSAAIVTDQEGTTRDYLTRQIDVAGLGVTCVDTAGFEVATDRLGHATQRMTRNQASQARLQLFCVDSTREMNRTEKAELQRAIPDGVQRMLVLTKCDQPRKIELVEEVIETSSVTGSGVDELRDAIQLHFDSFSEGGAVPSTTIRCRESLRLASDSLKIARDATRGGMGEEIVAVELRTALEELGQVVGAVYTDDILDRIFSRFCIGK